MAMQDLMQSNIVLYIDMSEAREGLDLLGKYLCFRNCSYCHRRHRSLLSVISPLPAAPKLRGSLEQ